MAVIRQVKKVIHYNMDVSEQELSALLSCIRYRRTTLVDDPYKVELVQLLLQIQAALDNG